MNKIRAVIFDLDGTIADTLPLCIAAFRKAIEPLALRSVSDDEIIATFGPSEEGTIKALIPMHYDKGIADYLHYYETMHTLCSAPFEGIPELLTALKANGIKIAMVTGKGKHSTLISLRQFGFGDLFEIIETGSPDGPRKAEGIRLILESWQLKKDTVLYVGDAPSDIVACHKVGIPVIAAAWATTAEPLKLKSLNPTEIFYSVQDFSLWLRSAI